MPSILYAWAKKHFDSPYLNYQYSHALTRGWLKVKKIEPIRTCVTCTQKPFQMRQQNRFAFLAYICRWISVGGWRAIKMTYEQNKKRQRLLNKTAAPRNIRKRVNLSLMHHPGLLFFRGKLSTTNKRDRINTVMLRKRALHRVQHAAVPEAGFADALGVVFMDSA